MTSAPALTIIGYRYCSRSLRKIANAPVESAVSNVNASFCRVGLVNNAIMQKIPDTQMVTHAGRLELFMA